MKLLKKIIFVIIAIVVLGLIMGLFMEDKFSVSKSVVVDLSSEEVFDYLKNLKNQDEYSVWNMKDPNMEKAYEGTDGEVGFIAKWDSDNKDLGSGEQEIVAIENGKRIDFKLRFKEPFEAENDAYILTESIGENRTKITWGIKGVMAYPMNLMLLFMDMDNMLGTDLENGLKNLKKVLENTDTE